MVSIKKVISPLVFLVLILFSASVCAFNLGKDSKGNFFAWDVDSMPLRYWIHLENPSDKNNEVKVRAVIRAFESWEMRSLSLVSFRYSGITDADKAEFDGINLVTWVNHDWSYNPDTIAYTTLWVTDSGKILDADIELNAEFFGWSSEGEMNKMDIHNVLTHEVGHFIGIEHSIESTVLSMFPIVMPGEVRKRVVKPDDIKAAEFLYPVSSIALELFDFPAMNLSDELVLAERLDTNYPALGEGKHILCAAGIRLNARGDAGIAALLSDSGKYLLGVYPKPGNPDEDIRISALDSWDIQDLYVKDFTCMDIDGDDIDEIIVLGVDDMANHAVYVFDSPEEGAFKGDTPKKWMARDLWRVPGNGDNLLLFALDLDGDGKRETATLSYTVEGVYMIKSYNPPARFDSTNEDALLRGEAITIPFSISGAILDADSLDIDGDGAPELIALIKGDFGYTVQGFRITPPQFPEDVQQFKPLFTMSLVLEKNEYPLSLTTLNGLDMAKPEMLIIVGKSSR
jgi:hypothetical protein